MSNVLGLCKHVLLRFINIPRFSIVQVSDAKATKNGYKILVTGVKFFDNNSTVKKYSFLTANHDFSLNYGHAEQHHKIIFLIGLL